MSVSVNSYSSLALSPSLAWLSGDSLSTPTRFASASIAARMTHVSLLAKMGLASRGAVPTEMVKYVVTVGPFGKVEEILRLHCARHAIVITCSTPS